MNRLTREHSRQLIGTAFVVAALVVLLIGYTNIRTETEVALQLPYLLTAGIGALVLTALGVAMLRSQDDQAILERQAEMEATVYELTERVGYLTQLLEAAILPDPVPTGTNAHTPARVG